MSEDDYTSIPTDLPPRFQIRRLEEKHVSWASAIVIHSNMFHSPIWTKILPVNKCARATKGFVVGEYLIRHQIDSGLSFGVFDTEYKLKRPESEATGGKLYWDLENVSKDETGAELLDQMDFPLCSVALAYDGVNPLDPASLAPLIELIPQYHHVYFGLAASDKRDPASWQPTGPRQVLMRNATASRHDIEGKQIMKKLAYFLMRYAHSLGFRSIQIECLHDKVDWVWNHPPTPFVGTTVSAIDCGTYEVLYDGKMVRPMEGTNQRATKVYVDLRPEDKVEKRGERVGDNQIGALG